MKEMMTLKEAMTLYQPEMLIIKNLNVTAHDGVASLDRYFVTEIDADWDADALVVTLSPACSVQKHRPKTKTVIGTENDNAESDCNNPVALANYLTDLWAENNVSFMKICENKYNRDRKNLTEYDMETNFFSRYLEKKLNKWEQDQFSAIHSLDFDREDLVNALIDCVIKKLLMSGAISY